LLKHSKQDTHTHTHTHTQRESISILELISRVT
jgi:hypothetical protein